jgi:aryl-alcohol dehydrogenase-like predicted oxidoreductase
MIAQRPFGASGATLPILGFGVSGPHATRLVPRAQTIGLVRQALEAGAALFDTAPFYGDGEAERRLGEALEGVRDRAFVCSKAGTVSGARGLAKDFSPAHLAATVEASLKRLRTDRLDALFLHGPRREDINGETLDALDRLKAEGKIRFAGVCGRGPELGAAIGCGRLDLVMAPAGPAFAKQALARTASARAAGMGVIGFEIMTRAATGRRALRSAADLWYLARSLRRRLSGAGAQAAHGEAGPLDDLAWALAGEACDCALVTTTRPGHLAADIEIAERAGAHR